VELLDCCFADNGDDLSVGMIRRYLTAVGFVVGSIFFG
jgi:hypothetical protein